jgi:hypothetical protein
MTTVTHVSAREEWGVFLHESAVTLREVAQRFPCRLPKWQPRSSSFPRASDKHCRFSEPSASRMKRQKNGLQKQDQPSLVESQSPLGHSVNVFA